MSGLIKALALVRFDNHPFAVIFPIGSAYEAGSG